VAMPTAHTLLPQAFVGNAPGCERERGVTSSSPVEASRTPHLSRGESAARAERNVNTPGGSVGAADPQPSIKIHAARL